MFRASRIVLGCLAIAIFCGAGCRQGGGANGFAGSAPLNPITQLSGQTAMTGPTFPSLGPFGASARVPPPSTGSYGSAATNTNFGNGVNYAPAGFTPNGVQPMGFNQSSDSLNSSQIANAGGGQWVETATQDGFAAADSHSNLNTHNKIRSGGMQVSDLTGGPPPPGYQPPVGYQSAPTYPPEPAYQPGYQPGYQPPPVYQPAPLVRAPSFPNPAPANAQPDWNATSPNPMRSSSTVLPPVSGGGIANSAPAANQPAFSTADRPLQWQAPRR